MTLIFDIETTSLPVDSLGHLKPDLSDITAPSTYKDPDKITAHIEKKKADKLEAWESKLALRPESSRLAAWGVWNADLAAPEYEVEITESGEAAALQNLWGWLESSPHICGHNCLNFDLPWLVRRSAMVGVAVPAKFRPDAYGRFDRRHVSDTMLWWDARGYISLDRLAAVFGIEGKALPEGKHVTSYAEWSREEQVDYLVADLRVTLEIAQRASLATKAAPKAPRAPALHPQDVMRVAAKRLSLTAGEALEELERLPDRVTDSTTTQNSHATALKATILLDKLHRHYGDSVPADLQKAADAAWESAAHSWVTLTGIEDGE
jgi:hypothetical protein